MSGAGENQAGTLPPCYAMLQSRYGFQEYAAMPLYLITAASRFFGDCRHAPRFFAILTPPFCAFRHVDIFDALTR